MEKKRLSKGESSFFTLSWRTFSTVRARLCSAVRRGTAQRTQKLLHAWACAKGVAGGSGALGRLCNALVAICSS